MAYYASCSAVISRRQESQFRKSYCVGTLLQTLFSTCYSITFQSNDRLVVFFMSVAIYPILISWTPCALWCPGLILCVPYTPCLLLSYGELNVNTSFDMWPWHNLVSMFYNFLFILCMYDSYNEYMLWCGPPFTCWEATSTLSNACFRKCRGPPHTPCTEISYTTCSSVGRHGSLYP